MQNNTLLIILCIQCFTKKIARLLQSTIAMKQSKHIILWIIGCAQYLCANKKFLTQDVINSISYIVLYIVKHKQCDMQRILCRVLYTQYSLHNILCMILLNYSMYQFIRKLNKYYCMQLRSSKSILCIVLHILSIQCKTFFA